MVNTYLKLISADITDMILSYRHMWMARIVQEPPTEMNIQSQKWWTEPTPNFTGTRSAFRTYSTTKAKITAWDPIALPRQ